MGSGLPCLKETEDGNDWADKYEFTMSDRGNPEDDQRMEEWASVCMKPGSPARRWYNKQPLMIRESFGKVKTAIVETFARRKGSDKWFNELLQLRPNDNQAVDEDLRAQHCDNFCFILYHSPSQDLCEAIRRSLFLPSLRVRTEEDVTRGKVAYNVEDAVERLRNLPGCKRHVTREELETKWFDGSYAGEFREDDGERCQSVMRRTERTGMERPDLLPHITPPHLRLPTMSWT
ncbi:hypothetical protein QFC20_007862 [Naganishia adeliensis]|uniref:Uncharacterized protein n=1 Tax=Naganishia adeliensis TaxID=92952 RepID=A0ACC2UUE5_9TREE|nr:hypothetical protein QFC20_007862 [Naganishia adeliensis]